MALAGFDVACWDALSLAAGLPLASYIGSQPRPIPAHNSNGPGLMQPEQAADEAEVLLEHGFRAVKLRLGPTAEQDLAVGRVVRRRLPDSIALMADYNQALTVTEAIRRGQGLDGEGFVTLPCREREVSAPQELSGRRDRRPPRVIAAARSTRCVWAEVRWRWTLKVLYTAACAERNFWAEPGLLNRCILRSRRRVG